ncbi:MAG: hypothetical protein ABI947_23295 [Chloroflexota bacterium]
MHNRESFIGHYRSGVFQAIVPFAIILIVLLCLIPNFIDIILKTLLLLTCFAIMAFGTMYQRAQGKWTIWSKDTFALEVTSGDLLSILVGSFLIIFVKVVVLFGVMCLVWPLFELVRQSKFLEIAYKNWQQGLVLVYPTDNSPVRAATYVAYESQPRVDQASVKAPDTEPNS